MRTVKTDVLVVGSGPAGFAAAYYVKQLNPDLKVTVVRREEVSIVPCAIPYMFYSLGGVKGIVASDYPLEELGVEIEIGEVKSLNVSLRIARLNSGVEIEYNRLVLATGSRPSSLNVLGSNLRNVFYLYKDFKYLSEMYNSVKDAHSVLIVGGGFAGVEMAEEISRMGKKVTIVEALPHCLQLNFDEDICVKAEEELRRLGVSVRTSDKVVRIFGEDRVKGVKLEGGEEIEADVVIVSIGIRPDVELAREVGLKIDERGFIVVDSHMMTSIPGIFAVGDCSQKLDFLTGKPVPVMLSSVASSQAQVIAYNVKRMTDVEMRGIAPSYVTRVGNYVFGVCGYTESLARKEGLDVETHVVETTDKYPAVMPNARKLVVKLIALRDRKRLIGVEAYGSDKVVDVINMFSIIIQKGMTVSDLISASAPAHPQLTPPPIWNPLRASVVKLYK